MAETSNRSKMAELISKDIFSEFGWEREGPINENWHCENPDHNKVTHPTDIVFSYKEPYEPQRTYVNCDLKSYNSKSIEDKGRLRSALESLAMSIGCAQLSKEWQDKYLRADDTANVIGLLFIYNHDGLYDKDFADLLNRATEDKLPLTRKNRFYVFSPKEICTLATIANDILVSRGRGNLPHKDLCSFFYPDQISRVVTRKDWSLPATIEMLKSSKIVIKYKSTDKAPQNDGIDIYYKREGSHVEEFIYLIDYLFHWQMISKYNQIRIKLTNPSADATAVFGRAIKDYTSRYGLSEELSERLQNVKIESITKLVTEFNETEIGMEG